MDSLTDLERDALLAACREIPAATSNYRNDDFVENLLLCVLDFRMRGVVVNRAIAWFQKHTKASAPDMAGLKALFVAYPNDQNGNRALAQRLFGYQYGNRAQMLRNLVIFFEAEGVVDQEALVRWMQEGAFSTHFQGNVKGLGLAVYQAMALRVGEDTVKPDVHIHRFITGAIGRSVSDSLAIAAIVQAAESLNRRPRELDGAIWETRRAPL